MMTLFGKVFEYLSTVEQVFHPARAESGRTHNNDLPDFVHQSALNLIQSGAVPAAAHLAGCNSALLRSRMLHTLLQQHLRQNCEAATSWSAAWNTPLAEYLELHRITVTH